MKARGFVSANTTEPRLPLKGEFQGPDPEDSPKFYGVVRAHKVSCRNNVAGTIFLCEGVWR